MTDGDIIKEYASGVSRGMLCKKYAISWNKLTNLLKNNDVYIRTVKDNSKKYTCDTNFFKIIDNEEKAYWLGFIYADGCITKNKLTIRLSSLDKEHLDKFKKSINSNHPIHDYKCTHGFSKLNNFSSNICIYSEKLVNDLINYGVVYNKSLILKFPCLEINLIKHFIRGYFDGDGSVSLTKYSKNKGGIKKYIKGVFSIYGTKEFLEELKRYLPCNFSLNKEKRRDSNTWHLKTSSMKKTYIMHDYFYNETTIYLDRKFNKFKEIINEYEHCRKNR